MKLTNKNSLMVSEAFYSIQGEGPTMGHPSVFLRLTACNLTCSSWSYVDPDTGEHLGCDSKAVWRTGNRMSFNQIIDHWSDQGWLDSLAAGAHLIVTGGEPMLQQEGLVGFLNRLFQEVDYVYVEVETNGTIKPTVEFDKYIEQYNVSAKLSNNGDPREKRINPEALEWHAERVKSIFKFVISAEQDLDEMRNDFEFEYDIPSDRIYLMPEGGSSIELDKKSQWIAELCKSFNYNYSDRLQIRIWGEVTGV